MTNEEIREILTAHKVVLLTLLLLTITSLSSASTISVSNIDYVANSSFYDNGHLQIEFIADGTGETISAKIPAEKISSAANGETSKDLKITGEVEEVRAEYGIEDRNVPRIKDIEYVREEFNSELKARNWAKNNCIDSEEDGNINYEYYRKFRILSWDHYVNCAIIDHNNPTFNVGFIQSPADVIVKVNWTIVAEGEQPETVTISNQASKEGSIERVGNHTQIEFVSLKDIGSSPPNPQNTYAAYNSKTGWRLINSEDYNNYATYLSNEVPNKIKEMPYLSEKELEEWKREEEADFENFYTKAQSEYSESAIHDVRNPNINISEIEEGVLIYEPKSDFEWFNSEFLIRIDGGKYLKIEKELAEPQIVEAVSEANVTDLMSSHAEIKVTNKGTGTGRFEGRTSCGSNLTSQGTAISRSVLPGEIVSFYPIIAGSSNKDFVGKCNFILEDLETGKEDQVSFAVDFSQAEECAPGKYFVVVNSGREAIYQCGDDGVSWKLQEECNSSEYARANDTGYVCQEHEASKTQRDMATSLNACEIDLTKNLGFSFLKSSHTVSNPFCLIENELEKLSYLLRSLIVFSSLFLVAALGFVFYRHL